MENENKKELTITRTFDAPRELVWKAWTDPKLLEKWWGPRGVTTPTCEFDATPGGQIYIVMLAGKELGSYAGVEWPMKGTVKELRPPEMMVYTSEAIDDKKKVIIETHNVLTLEKMGNKTKMTFKIVVNNVTKGAGEAALAGMGMGWNQSIDKLGEFIEKANPDKPMALH